MHRTIAAVVLMGVVAFSYAPIVQAQSSESSESAERIVLLQHMIELLTLVQHLQAQLAEQEERARAMAQEREVEAAVVSAPGIDQVDENDHVLGNPLALQKIITYTDLDCPFCARFHDTMTMIMDEYGVTGQLAWVVRHFPLEQLHPTALDAALGAECAADLGGESAFWDYVAGYYEGSTVDTLVTELGLSSSAFDSCVSDVDTLKGVQADAADAIENGAQGTPWSVLIDEAGDILEFINGALPQEAVAAIIERN
jgi:protein-disulfide isomerase